MRILLVGGLNVNPERFLPVIKLHEVYGIWESQGLWGHSVPAGGPYAEIPTISIDEVRERKIGIIWSLLSPWDGVNASLRLMERYPEIPFVRQSQGAVTPWWHDPQHPANKKRGVNYSFAKFKAMLEKADALMVNSDKYRDCLIDQGIEIKGKPCLLSNGMAFNYDLVTEPAAEKLSATNGQPHVTVIGTPRHDKDMFMRLGIHVHYHSASLQKRPTPSAPFFHLEDYYGDAKMLHRKPVSMKSLFNLKKRAWYKTFTRYDAGLMHLNNNLRLLNRYKSIDLDVPGRVNTYIMCGLPPVIWNEDSSIRDFLADSGCALAFDDEQDLVAKLKDKRYMCGLQEQTLKVRKDFSMQHEIRRVTAFFEGLLR